MNGKLIVTVFTLVLVVGVVIGVLVNRRSDGEKISSQKKAVSQFCGPTEHQDVCIRTLNSANTNDPKELLKVTILSTQTAVQKLLDLSDSLIWDASNKDNSSKMALEDCKDLLQFAIQDLQTSFFTVGTTELHTIDNRTADLMTWLNAVITYQQTCLDGFEGENNNFRDSLKNSAMDSTYFTSNALTIISQLSKILKSVGLKLKPTKKNRRRLQVGNDAYPSWFSASDRKLLDSHGKGDITPNAIVAKDGSGDFSTIQKALDAYPKDLQGRYVIYVKEGIYDEYVTVTQKQPNVFIYGDGNSRTIVTGNKSNSQGFKTWKSATFTATGKGFIAKSMGFVNTAGPDGHQAVALRIASDYSAIFDCRIDGYQNSLYTHAYRQFFRNCVISGTIDFIFGDATVIIQNSFIIIRRSSPDNDQYTVTAQARSIKQQTTTMVIHNCTIVPDEKLYPDRLKVKAFLGRPWKDYATTIFIENTIGDFIHPDGYIPYEGNFATDNCKYYEYWNRGPGASAIKRVKWSGVKVITKAEAQEYTVWKLFESDQFLQDAGIPHDGLIY